MPIPSPTVAGGVALGHLGSPALPRPGPCSASHVIRRRGSLRPASPSANLNSAGHCRPGAGALNARDAGRGQRFDRPPTGVGKTSSGPSAVSTPWTDPHARGEVTVGPGKSVRRREADPHACGEGHVSPSWPPCCTADPHACGETQVPERPVMTSRGAPSRDEETGETRIVGYTLPSQGRVPGEVLCMRQDRCNARDSRVG